MYRLAQFRQKLKDRIDERKHRASFGMHYNKRLAMTEKDIARKMSYARAYKHFSEMLAKEEELFQL